jgi:CRP-like cAMP-binding protein
MDRAEIEAMLAARGWLAGCEPGFRRAVFARARPVRFAADAFVFHAGDLAGGIYGVARGGFAVSVATAAATPAAATIIRSGAWFGNGPLVAARRRMLSFRATEPSVALHLPLAAVRELTASGVAAACAFADLSAINMQLSVRVVSDLLIPGAERRIAATLLRLTRADEGDRPEDPQGFRLGQATLAEMANASRRSVVRTLSALEAQGLVALRQRRIAILDADGLARLAYG